MGKKNIYLIVDTETATLPFVNEIAKDSNNKKKISIMKPLVYDIGWILMDRKGEIIKKENYLIQETFFVPNIFNTAYYKDKRKIYMKLLENNQINVGTWNTVMESFVKDLNVANISAAYNACFDFKKAIPFTEQYIKNLYSSHYDEWERRQKERCQDILEGKDSPKNEDYLKPMFKFRDKEYLIVDLWGLSCKHLIAKTKYKDYCLDNKLLTNSGIYFKTSAETAYQYITNKFNFMEEHTALSDSIIEGQILAKVLKKIGVKPEIEPFPFRELGRVVDYDKIYKNDLYKQNVIDTLEKYIEINKGCDLADQGNPYWRGIVSTFYSLCFGEKKGDKYDFEQNRIFGEI